MHSLMLGTDSRLPLYQRLKDEFQTKIAAGDWPPGAPIPAETELTKTYGVAIGTVRKAVDKLVHEGLLQRSHGRGTFVRRPNFDASFFRFFRQVDAAGNRTIPESQVLSRILETAAESVAQALALPQEAQVLHLERLRVIDRSNTVYEHIWLPAERFSALQEIEPACFGNLLYPFYEERCAQVVASARETLTVEPADAQTANMLKMTAGKPVVVIERIASGYDRTPLEYRQSRGAADNFRYQIDIV